MLLHRIHKILTKTQETAEISEVFERILATSIVGYLRTSKTLRLSLFCAYRKYIVLV